MSAHPKDPVLQGRKTGPEIPTQPMGAGHALPWVISQQKAVVGQPEPGNEKSYSLLWTNPPAAAWGEPPATAAQMPEPSSLEGEGQPVLNDRAVIIQALP